MCIIYECGNSSSRTLFVLVVTIHENIIYLIITTVMYMYMYVCNVYIYHIAVCVIHVVINFLVLLIRCVIQV